MAADRRGQLGSTAQRRRRRKAKGTPHSVESRDQLQAAHEASPVSGAKLARDDRGRALACTTEQKRRAR
jgi:hypothetical protein